MTRPSRRSPRDRMHSTTPSRTSWYLNFTLRCGRTVSRMSCCRRRSSPASVMGSHWNEECGLGTSDEVLTVTVALRRPAARASSCTRMPVRAMPTTSASVSVGRPIMKYILSWLQPWLQAICGRGVDVGLGDPLVDEIPQALGAGLGGDGEAGAAHPREVRRQFLREPVDAHRGDRQRDAVGFEAVHHGAHERARCTSSRRWRAR